VYQRFGVAQRHSPDMGSAYVDVAREGRRRACAGDVGQANGPFGRARTMPKLDAIIMFDRRRPTVVVEPSRPNVAKGAGPVEAAPEGLDCRCGRKNRSRPAIRLMALFGIEAEGIAAGGHGPR